MNKSIKGTWFQFLLLVALSSCLALTSCGKDDKDGPSGSDDGETSAIVGTWVAEEDNGNYQTTYQLTFTAKGDYSYLSVDSDDGYTERGKGTYTLAGKKIYVKVKWEEDNEWETDVYEIISISSKTMVLDGDDFGGIQTFVRS